MSKKANVGTSTVNVSLVPTILAIGVVIDYGESFVNALQKPW